jgi:hypothetical protein
VRDLIIDIPDFTNAPPQLGVHKDGVATTLPTTVGPPSIRSPRTREQLLDDLKVQITSTVDPLSWRGNTGTLGSIRETDGQLIITQTPANHEKIQQLLASLRGPRAIQVTVETRFLTISRPVEKLLPAGGSWMPVDGSDAQMCQRFLDAADVKYLIGMTQASRDSTMITAPRITLFNGQRAYVVVSKQTAYVSDLTRIIDKKTGKEAFDPVIGIVDSGVLVDCRATVGGTNKEFATLALAPQLATLVDLFPRRWSGSTPGHEATIQVPEVRKLALSTTVTMPGGKSVLYRFPPEKGLVEVSPGKMQTRENTTLLLVKPTIIVQREEPATQPFPRLGGAP